LSSRLLLALASAALLVAAAPQRIISLSPNTTEILYGVGAFSKVIAVSQFCSYPPEVSKLPRVGAWQTTDVEKIVALHPDLVILTKAQEPFIADKLIAFSLASIAVPSETLADIYTAIHMIGKATGRKTEAAHLIADTRSSLDRIRNATTSLPRRTTLICVDRTPGTLSDLYVATPGSYLVELIDIAGGKSITAPQASGYGKLSQEALLTLNPEMIIDLAHGPNIGDRVLDAWKDMPDLRAVREKHIYPIYDPTVVHPSQLVVNTAQLFAKILHPEAAR
jgi:iron complex transport system substrate-binding protein